MNLIPELVELPASVFLMGCDCGQPNERPVHRVSISAFVMGKYQVTNLQYDEFLSATRHRRPKYRDDPRFSAPDQPVVAVSWFDTVAYCEWLSQLTGRQFRLPTEAEWEYAARGGVEGLLYPWGNEPAPLGGDPKRWLDERPEPVGQSKPNGFGLFNMCENVHEWCSDWFDAAYYQVSPENNPPGPTHGAKRASRGGSWRHQVKTTRCAARSSINPSFEYSDYGFRVAGLTGGAQVDFWHAASYHDQVRAD